MNRDRVYKIIDEERDYQQSWNEAGVKADDRELGTWLMILKNRLDMAQQGWAVRKPEKERVECIKQIMKMVAVGVACLEQYGDILEE